MVAEWLLLFVLIAGCAGMFLGKANGLPIRLGICCLLALALGGAWLWQNRLKAKAISRADLSVPRLGRPEEYAGSDSCRACHPNQHNSWHRSFHRTMTQVASPESVRGPFDNVTLELNDESYRLQKRGDEFWVEMPDPDFTLGIAPARNTLGSEVAGTARVWRRLSLVTGSHHMQAYWVDNKHGNQQFSFPFTYLFEDQRWVPRRSVFIRNPNTKVFAQIWNVGCISCHTTAGQPFKESRDLPAFNSRVAELGISCEACHGPGARHVRENSDPWHRYTRHLRAKGDEHVVNPAKLSPKRSAEVCGRCHSIHGSLDEQQWEREGETYHPGEELEKTLKIVTTSKARDFRQSHFWNDGMIRVSGRDYNGLIKSPCFQRGEMSCLSCHSMHDSSPTNQLAKGMESNQACGQCHERIMQDVTQHTHHPAESSGSLCYNCHMPYTTFGLLIAIRSHQITSPTVKSTLQTGRPNACNLCHLDKTLDWTGQNLTKWYQQPAEEVKEKTVAASISWALQGDAAQRALIAWHMGWGPARAASGEDWLAPYLSLLLQDNYPAVRYVANRSLKSLPGFGDFSYDFIGTNQVASARAAYALWAKLDSARPRPAQPSLLLKGPGQLDEDQAGALLKTQSQRIIELDE